MPQWWVSLQSPVTTEVRDALTSAGIGLTGLAHGLNETHTHASVQVEAESANDAVAMTRRALAGLQVIVDPDAQLLSD
jgi:hypothetical protein